jgi:hypothetical protein
MKQFDLVYEQTMDYLREQVTVIDKYSDLANNILKLVGVLQQRDYLDDEQTPEEIRDEVIQRSPLTLLIGTDKKAYLPETELTFLESDNVDEFIVKSQIIDKKKFANIPTEKTFGELKLPSEVIPDILDYLELVKKESVANTQAVDEMPQEEGGNAQPGGGESALPGVGGEAAPEVPPAVPNV